ncbi:hypothetical protein CHARACLAT_007453 [Characodon lateralis]|uniref:Uncharacterized protein n=1 Tax=Characodon lateralis TaxID=208331 RepID=A0ABU7DH23_9TELE|nr:hypothetical protein [Characodon lateralis]
MPLQSFHAVRKITNPWQNKLLFCSPYSPTQLCNSLAMEETESTAVDRTTVADENQKTENILMSSKPLHRFVQKQPRSLGIVILVFGCAEVLMGIVLASDSMKSSFNLYIPFWQGSLSTVIQGYQHLSGAWSEMEG